MASHILSRLNFFNILMFLTLFSIQVDEMDINSNYLTYCQDYLRGLPRLLGPWVLLVVHLNYNFS